ncbi:hypothetical protein AAZX31_11G199600 [Glycine max]
MDVEFGNTLDGVKFDTTIEIVIKRRGDVYNLDVGNLYCEDFASDYKTSWPLLELRQAVELYGRGGGNFTQRHKC